MIKEFFTEFRFTLALRRVMYVSLAVGVYTLLPLFFQYLGLLSKFGHISSGLETMLALVLSLLLVFRANRAYERWWEARSQWGVLVNVSRNLAIKIKTILQPSQDMSEQFHYLISQFCVALMHHLRLSNYRTLSSSQALASKHQLTENEKHIPLFICQRLYQMIEQYKQQGKINDMQFLMLDRDLSQFMHVAGACEKIKTTLIILSFRSFVHHIMIIFFIFLPWKLTENYGLWSVPLMILISYITFALEGIARHMEEPFGKSVDDVQMASICKTINQSTGQALKS